jgi:hypothetical protein
MGLLNFILGRRSKAASPSALPGASLFEDRYFTLEKPHWFGPCSRSPNGRWLISWRDTDIDGNRGGHRNSGKGAYLLYDTHAKRVVVQGHLERPNHGHVADNGIFVLEDWLFVDDLAGTFYAFAPQGQVLLKRKVTANLASSAISPNGKYAVCQTNNSGTEDSFSLFLFDLQSGEELFHAEPSAGWTMDYTIDEARTEVLAHFKNLGTFRYDRNGQFLDSALLEEARLHRGDFSDTILTAERILQHAKPAPERVRQVLAAVQRARKEGADRDNGWKATALKVQGLAHEALGETSLAIDIYEQALAINPKIGVKRRLTALKKRQLQE